MRHTGETWWVVVNEDNRALAVYGSELRDVARAKRDEINKRSGFVGARLVQTTHRPPLGFLATEIIFEEA